MTHAVTLIHDPLRSSRVYSRARGLVSGEL